MQDASWAGLRPPDGSKGFPGDTPTLTAHRRLPLVLLPGTLCDRRVFEPLIQRLPAREVVVLEMTGATSTQDLAARLLEAAPDRFALLGFSLGGIVALEMAAVAPHRLAGLALLNTNPRPVPLEDHAHRRANAEVARRMGLGAYVGQVLWPSYVAAPASDTAELRGLIIDMAEGFDPDVFADQIEIALSRVDSRPRLSRITAPTLLLSGAADTICPVEMQREMTEALPCARLAVVPGAGHFAVLEAPDAVAACVTDWLDEIDARQSHPVGATLVQARNEP